VIGMANWGTRVIIIAVISTPLCISAFVLGPSALDLVTNRRPPERYIVPTGFSGWARVNFRQTSAPPLPVESGHRVLRLDAQGTLATSDRPRPGHGKDEFFEATSAGLQALPYVGVCKGGMIWGLETLVDEHTDTPYTRFFVGSEAQYRQEVDPTGKNFPSSC
jgi:hypothetical protein